MLILYTFLQILILPVFLVYVIYRLIFTRLSVREITGRVKDAFCLSLPKDSAAPILIHSSSVGEIKIASLLAREIRKRNENGKVILSVVTSAGKKLAVESGNFFRVFYFPVDLPFFTKIFVRKIAPGKAIIIETEIWPRFIKILSGICEIYYVNGRFGNKSFKNYSRVKWFLKPFLSKIKYYFARSNEDFSKAGILGVKNGAAYGNIKFNYEDNINVELELKIRDYLDKKLILFGSIRGGEEEDIVRVIDFLYPKYGCNFFIIPRHIERVNHISNLLRDRKLDFSLWTGELRTGIILVDEIGVLFDLYRYCYISFVGGSLYPYGGQNPVEPAFFGKPILFGKYMDNFREESALLLKNEAAVMANSPEELRKEIIDLLSNPDRAKKLGENSLKTYEQLKCDLAKMLSLMNLNVKCR